MNKRNKWLLTKFALGVFIASPISMVNAIDKCTFYDGENLDGKGYNANLLSPSQTYSNYNYANTSTRFSQEKLEPIEMSNKISSVKITAKESDVAFYVFDKGNYNGISLSIHCKKGFTCTSKFKGTKYDNFGQSVMCQRVYNRQIATETAMHGPLRAAEKVPTIDLKTLKGKSDEVAWFTRFRMCKDYKMSCKNDLRNHYVDLFRFYTTGRKYSTNWKTSLFVWPHLSAGKMQFPWTKWSWYASGPAYRLIKGDVKDGIKDAAEKINTSILNGIKEATSANGLDFNRYISNKRRLEMQMWNQDKALSTNVYSIGTDLMKASLSYNESRTPSLIY